jgi:MFS superfamily sulfate permease-like transporter
MIGDVPAGLPSLAFPSVPARDVLRLLGTALAISIVILVQSAAVGRSFAGQYGYRDDTDRDLFALAAANAGSALTGGFAINGSPPRTQAGADAGGSSQVVNLVMAAVTACLLLFATGLLAYLPVPVLDAVVFGIGFGLVKTTQLREIRRRRPSEFVTAAMALVVVAFVGVEEGIFLAVIVSLVDRLRRQYRPSDDVLVHDGVVADRLHDRVPDDGPLDGVLVYRFGVGLFFENAGFFEQRVQGLVASAKVPVRAIVLDAAAMDDIDFSGAEILRRMAAQFARGGVRIYVTELAPSALEGLRRAGLDEVLTVVPRLEEAILEAARPS